MKKHLLTKTFLFLAFLIWANVGWGQLLFEENFDYSTGYLTLAGTDNVSGGNWVNYSGTSYLQVTSGSLSYMDYASSGVGNALNISNSVAEDAYRAFTTQSEGSTIYAAFLISLSTVTGLPANTSGTGDYGIAFLPSSSTSLLVGRISFRTGSVAGTYQIGLRTSSSNSAAVFSTTDFTPVNDTCLLVVKYNLISGNTNDVVSLWINPAITTTEPSADLTQTSALTTDPTDIARFAVRNSSTSPTGFIDGIRVGTTWAEAVSAPDIDPPVATWDPTDASTGIEISKTVTLTFDEPVLKTDSTELVDADLAGLITFEKNSVGSGLTVANTATIDATKKIITINPDADLEFNTTYYVVFGAVEDTLENVTDGDTLSFTTKPDTDKDSKVVAPVTQIAAATVESVVTDSIPVFSFTISDLGTLDGMATKVTQITLKAGANNTVSFTDNISGGYLISESGINIPFAGEPNITAGSIEIPFAVDALTIPDGEDSTYTVYNNITLNVTATDLFFFSEPVNVYVGNDIEPSVKVNAVDSNGNVDTDYITDISLTATGATLVGSPVTAIPVMGKATFSSVAFSDAATGVTLTAASGTLNEKVSAAFDVLAVPETDIFFSEYIEGGGNNKSLEIYNGTGATVDLSNYIIRINANGSTWTSFFSFPASTNLADGDVYVISHAEAAAEILAVTDTAILNPYVDGTSYVAVFNGDDVRGLFKINGTDTTLIDIIGRYDLVDPGTAWNVAGVTNATANHTILRKVETTHGTVDWDLSAGTTAENSEWKVFDQDFIANLGSPTPAASSETAITEFTFGNDYDLGEAVINEGTSTVDITVINGTDPSALSPTITLSAGATIDPLSGDTLDFTLPVVYTVTAEDGITTEAWTVTVTVSPTLSSYAEILEIEVADMDSAVINSALGEITVYMPYGSDVSSVKPLFDISAGATIADTTLAYDFATPQTYTVTAQDASTKAWEVTMQVKEIDYVTIHDIQYTTGTPADSPYKDQQIRTSGIVTAVKTGTTTSFYLQNGDGEWDAIYVYASTFPVSLGDSVELVATVAEYQLLTELASVTYLTILSSGNTVPDPIELTTLEVSNEAYESALVNITGATCISGSNGSYVVNDGSGDITIYKSLYADLALTIDKVYDITGVVTWYNGGSIFEIYPRSASDINTYPEISGVTLTPNAPTTADDVVVTATLTDVETTAENMTGALYWGTAEGSENTSVTFTQEGFTSVFNGTIPASTSSTIYYVIEANDGALITELAGSYSITTGINDPSGFVTMNIYPNPNNGQFTLELNAQKAGTFNVEIVNVAGQVVYQKQIEQDGLYKEQVNISEKAKGMYYIRINDGTSVKVQKLMIQ